MSRKIIIHIGSHKTGTSSIQRSLYNNKSLLKRYNIEYFTKSTHILKYQILDNVGNYVYYNLKSKKFIISSKLSEDLKKTSPSKTIIISSEDFWNIDYNEYKIFFNELKKEFDEIDIIAYIRRQDELALSLYQEILKMDSSYYNQLISLDDIFIKDPQKTPFYNYYQIFDNLLRFIPKERIKIKIFEKKLLKNQNVVDDFFNLIGINNDYQRFSENISVSSNQLQVLKILHKRRVDPIVRKYIIEQIKKNDKKFYPKKSSAKLFYNKLKNHNRELNRNFNISKNEYLFTDNFDQYGYSEENNAEIIKSEITNLINSRYWSLYCFSILFKHKIIKGYMYILYHIFSFFRLFFPGVSFLRKIEKNYIDRIFSMHRQIS